jgi:hypothetical protein
MGAIREYLVERAHSPWREYTGSAAEEQAGYAVAAGVVAGLERLPHLARYELDGEPYLAVDRPRRRVVLNERFFGPFIRPDAPRLAAGERVRIGTVKEPRITAVPVELVSFLIEAELIRTYWHVEARLGLEELVPAEGGVSALVEGRHVYYTDRRHEELVRFRIEVTTATGAVDVVGAAR